MPGIFDPSIFDPAIFDAEDELLCIFDQAIFDPDIFDACPPEEQTISPPGFDAGAGFGDCMGVGLLPICIEDGIPSGVAFGHVQIGVVEYGVVTEPRFLPVGAPVRGNTCEPVEC